MTDPHKLRRALLYKHDTLAAELQETPLGSFLFSYKPEYLAQKTEWLSLGLPFSRHLRSSEFKTLPPFLEGLIPEGWLLNIAHQLKPDLAKDRFGLLLAVARDCVGSVSVIPIDSEEKVPEDFQLPSQESDPQHHRKNPFQRCLICMSPLTDTTAFYHDDCAKDLFGQNTQVEYPYALGDLEVIAKRNIQAKIIIPGAQRKISASLLQESDHRARITLVGSGTQGLYVLKPEHPLVPSFPANEHLAMSLAKDCGLDTAAFGLVYSVDGRLAYITKRFDRIQTENSIQKRSLEDFGQIFSRVRDNDKYKDSFDKIGRFLRERSTNRIKDTSQFLDQVFLSYLIGNNDFHLRNISVFTEDNKPFLAPAYDITCTQLIDPEPEEDTTLPVNGKKRKLLPKDWKAFAAGLGFSDKAWEVRLRQFEKTIPTFQETIQKSLIPEEQKNILWKFIQKKLDRALG